MFILCANIFSFYFSIKRQLNNESRQALLCKLHFRHIWKFMSVLIMMKYWNYYIPAYNTTHLSSIILQNNINYFINKKTIQKTLIILNKLLVGSTIRKIRLLVTLFVKCSDSVRLITYIIYFVVGQ